LGTARLRHQANSLAFAPDGKTFATAGNDHLVRLWDVATGKELRRYTGHNTLVMSVAFASDGNTLVSADRMGMIRVWEVAGKEIRALGNAKGEYPLHSMILAPDDRTIVAVHQGWTVKLWDLKTGQETRSLTEHQNGVTGLVLSPDGKTFATRREQNVIGVWDVATGKELHHFKARQKSVSVFVYSPDGKSLATAGTEPVISLWDVKTGQEAQKFETPAGAINMLAFSPNGRYLASKGGDRAVNLWGVASGNVLRQLDLPLFGVGAMTFSPDGKLLAACQGSVIHLWDLAKNRPYPDLPGHVAGIYDLCYSAEGKRLTTAGEDRTVRLWDAATGKQLQTWTKPEKNNFRMLLEPDGKGILAPLVGKVVRWEMGTGKQTETPVITGLTDRPTCQAISPDGKILAGRGRDQVIRLWDLGTGKEVGRLQDAPGNYFYLVFSPDGKLLAGSGTDLPVRLWDVGTGKEVRQFKVVNTQGTFKTFSPGSLCFSPDGRGLLTVSTQVQLWEVATGQNRWRTEISAPGFHEGAFSPDGELVAVGCHPNDALLLDAATGALVAPLRGHTGRITGLRFSPAKQRLASSSHDGTVLIWDVAEAGKKARLARPTVKAEQLMALWKELGDADASKAHKAIESLVALGKPAVAFLSERLQGGSKADLEKVTRLIRQLDDTDFSIREKAHQELEALGEVAVPALRKALENGSSAEVRNRAERLLEARKQDPEAARLRTSRILEVLERDGTAEARALLKTLAGGKPETWVTQEAAAALRRLEQRQPSDP
jgi:WD40 repeat protein